MNCDSDPLATRGDISLGSRKAQVQSGAGVIKLQEAQGDDSGGMK